jgi:hypothetical protein
LGDVDLTGVEAKLKRAKAYAIELENQVNARFAPETQSFSFERESSGTYVAKVHGLPAVDPDWSLLVGEIVFHLRSCLDHLAWQIVLFDDGVPGRRTYYPIKDSPFDKKGRYERVQMNPRVMNPAILDALEITQPYRDVDGKLNPQSSQFSALRALRELNNIDKHRLLLVTAAALDVGNMWWGLPPDFESPGVRLNQGILEDHGPVAWFDFGSNVPPDGFDPHPAVRLTVREHSVAYLSGLSLPDFMQALCDFWVGEHVIGWRFRPIFEGLPPFVPDAFPGP